MPALSHGHDLYLVFQVISCIYFAKNLFILEIICIFAVEMMAYCRHIEVDYIRDYGTIGSYSKVGFRDEITV